MDLVSVPESVLKYLLLNVGLLTAGMGNKTVERQVEILWSHMPGTNFDLSEEPRSDERAEVIGIFTGRTL